jgi:5-methylcytosine-specific restriction endonuclease McrA
MGWNSLPAKRLHWRDQEGLCPLCEKPIDFEQIADPSYANIDHKLPVSHGGSDAYSNLQLTHTTCNSKKGCGCKSYARHTGIILPGLELSSR